MCLQSSLVPAGANTVQRGAPTVGMHVNVEILKWRASDFGINNYAI